MQYILVSTNPKFYGAWNENIRWDIKIFKNSNYLIIAATMERNFHLSKNFYFMLLNIAKSIRDLFH